MYVHVPVIAEAEIRQKKGVKGFSQRDAYMNVRFDLNEVSPLDAPIAIEGFDRHFGEYKTPSKVVRRKDPNPVGHLRYFEGDLWYPDFNHDNTIATVETWDWHNAAPKPYAPWELGEYQSIKAIAPKLSKRSWVGIDSFTHHVVDSEADWIAELRFSNIDERISLYQKHFDANVIAVDGMIYNRVEPFYVLEVNNNLKTIQATVAFNLDHEKQFSRPNTVRLEYFRIDRFDDMVEHINAAKGLNFIVNDKREILLGSRPDVKIADVYNFRDEDASMLHYAIGAYEGLLQYVHHLPIGTIQQWASIRDELYDIGYKISGSHSVTRFKRMFSKMDADAAERIGSHVSELVEGLEPYASGNMKLRNMNNEDELRKKMKALHGFGQHIQNRWNVRPMNLQSDTFKI